MLLPLNNCGHLVLQGLALQWLRRRRSWLLLRQLKWQRLLHLFEELIKALGRSRGSHGCSWLDKLLRGRLWGTLSQVCKQTLCVACLPLDVCSQFFEVVVAHCVAPCALRLLFNKITVIIIEVDRHSRWWHPVCDSLCCGLLYIRIIYLHLVSIIVVLFFLADFLFFRLRLVLEILVLFFLVFLFFISV